MLMPLRRPPTVVPPGGPRKLQILLLQRRRRKKKRQTTTKAARTPLRPKPVTKNRKPQKKVPTLLPQNLTQTKKQTKTKLLRPILMMPLATALTKSMINRNRRMKTMLLPKLKTKMVTPKMTTTSAPARKHRWKKLMTTTASLQKYPNRPNRLRQQLQPQRLRRLK